MNTEFKLDLSENAIPKDKKLAFGWYGGKYSHLNFIIPFIPRDAKHYCEVFAGSASILLNVMPYEIETLNDLDSEIVNFFRILRDRGEELIKKINLTCLSREELDRAVKYNGNDELEKARCFYVKARQTRTGLGHIARESRWSYMVNVSRNKTSAAVSRWWGGVDRLPDIISRLQLVQLENKPALNVLERYDSRDTVFYLDPPYVKSTRSKTSQNIYKYEMNNEEHIQLAKVLNVIKGRVLLSGYNNKLYEELYKDWRRVDDKPKNIPAARIKGRMVSESLWMNF